MSFFLVGSSPGCHIAFSDYDSSVLVAQLCLTLCNPMDWSPPGSSVHGILQVRILEWVASPFSMTPHSRPICDIASVSHGLLWPWHFRRVLVSLFGFFLVWDVLQLGFVWYFLVIILRLCVTRMDSIAGGASSGHHMGTRDVDMF